MKGSPVFVSIGTDVLLGFSKTNTAGHISCIERRISYIENRISYIEVVSHPLKVVSHKSKVVRHTLSLPYDLISGNISL